MPKLGFKRPFLMVGLLVMLALFTVSFISGALGKSILGDIGLPSWLSVPRPDPHLPPEAVFHLGGFPITNTILTSWLSILLLVLVSYLLTRRMRLIPKRLQTIFESIPLYIAVKSSSILSSAILDPFSISKFSTFKLSILF